MIATIKVGIIRYKGSKSWMVVDQDRTKGSKTGH